ncbi:DinB family protein [Saccharopolyspora sp. NPDC002376]
MPNKLSGERADILELLRTHRGFLRHTVQNLTEEQLRSRPTASELCLGGLIKHITDVEQGWADFIRNGRKVESYDEAFFAEHAASFVLTDEDTLDSLLAGYAEATRRIDEIIETVPDFDLSHELPDAPWEKEKGKRWTIRMALLHVAAEIAQHAGHADIIRETIDGQKTMG